MTETVLALDFASMGQEQINAPNEIVDRLFFNDRLSSSSRKIGLVADFTEIDAILSPCICCSTGSSQQHARACRAFHDERTKQANDCPIGMI